MSLCEADKVCRSTRELNDLRRVHTEFKASLQSLQSRAAIMSEERMRLRKADVVLVKRAAGLRMLLGSINSDGRGVPLAVCVQRLHHVSRT